jgi:hypothetical protein
MQPYFRKILCVRCDGRKLRRRRRGFGNTEIAGDAR